MQKTAKSVLADALTSHFNSMHASDVPNAIHVIDGNHLLDSMVYGKGSTYNDHIKEYTSHVVYKYGNESSVCFNGYSDSDTLLLLQSIDFLLTVN